MTIDGTPDKPEPDVRRGSERRWVLTNRRNLIEFVSGMVIRPVEALTKYYTDPLELTPGAVPVLTTPVPDKLVELAESSGPDVCFPILIELPETRSWHAPGTTRTSPAPNPTCPRTCSPAADPSEPAQVSDGGNRCRPRTTNVSTVSSEP